MILVLLLIVVAVVVAGSVAIEMVERMEQEERVQQGINDAHVDALQTAQRIHQVTWRARQAMFDEAQRQRRNG
jgi:hypothetical protein